MDSAVKEVLSGTRSVYEWTALEQRPTMIDGGGADSGGPNALLHGKAVWRPGTTGNAAMLIFNPAKRPLGKPWDNVYEYNTLTPKPAAIVYASWELQFTLLASDLSGNAREFEIEQCESGWTYNMAWQYKWSKVDGPPAWRMFDQIEEKWIAMPNLPAPSPKAGVFILIEAFFAIDREHGLTLYDSIVIDGVSYPVNRSIGKKQKWSPQTNYLHYATQIDSMGDGVPCTTQIKNWNVRGM